MAVSLPFVLTLTHSEAQEALRLLAFSRNLGESLSLFVIGITLSLASIGGYFFITPSLRLFGIWSVCSYSIRASIGITRHCSALIGTVRYRLVSLRRRSVTFSITLVSVSFISDYSIHIPFHSTQLTYLLHYHLAHRELWTTRHSRRLSLKPLELVIAPAGFIF